MTALPASKRWPNGGPRWERLTAAETAAEIAKYQPALSIEFWPWRDIPADRKREVTTHGDDWTMEVLGETFLGEPVWLPYMGGGT